MSMERRSQYSPPPISELAGLDGRRGSRRAVCYLLSLQVGEVKDTFATVALSPMVGHFVGTGPRRSDCRNVGHHVGPMLRSMSLLPQLDINGNTKPMSRICDSNVTTYYCIKMGLLKPATPNTTPQATGNLRGNLRQPEATRGCRRRPGPSDFDTSQ